MFKIFVKNLSLYGYHGVKPEEKQEGQYFVYNIEIKINKDSFSGSDNLSETVNYSDAIEIIKEINSQNKFDLLETLAEEISVRISKLSPLISNVKVRVEKINPPIKEKLDSVGVTYKLAVNKKSPDNEFEGKNQDNIKFEKIKDSGLFSGTKKVSKKGHRIVYLSIGTNKGNKLENIKKALYLIFKSDIFKILEVSSIYETEPMYFKGQDNFYNLAIKAAVKSSTNPFAVLGYIKNIEYEMGRESQPVKNGPRIIDIDILYIEDICINSDILKVPHPRLSERNFVMMPLSEVAPDFEINGENINEYIKRKSYPDKIVKINQDILIP